MTVKVDSQLNISLILAIVTYGAAVALSIAFAFIADTGAVAAAMGTTFTVVAVIAFIAELIRPRAPAPGFSIPLVPLAFGGSLVLYVVFALLSGAGDLEGCTRVCLAGGQCLCPTGPAEGCVRSCAASVFQYCEAWTDVSWLRQPACVLSTLAYVASGCWVIAVVKRQGDDDQPMKNITVDSMIYAAVAAFMGPGSMALHATMRAWGGFLDNFSIMVWLFFALIYSVRRLWFDDSATTRAVSWVGFGILVVVYGILSAAVFPNVDAPMRDIFVVGFAVIWLLHDGLFSWGWWGLGRVVRRQCWWFVIAIVLLLAAVTIWVIYNGSDLHVGSCPGGYSGHAVWHVLTAAVVLAAFLHFRSENHRSRLGDYPPSHWA